MLRNSTCQEHRVLFHLMITNLVSMFGGINLSPQAKLEDFKIASFAIAWSPWTSDLISVASAGIIYMSS